MEHRRARLALGWALLVALYAGVALLARSGTLTSVDPTLLVGLAALTLVLVSRTPVRAWWAAGLLLAVTTAALGLGLGLAPLVAVGLVVPSLVHAFGGAVLLRRLVPDLVVGGGAQGLEQFRSYVALIVVAAAASLAAVVAALAVPGLRAADPGVVDDLVAWGRSTVVDLVVLTAAVLLLGPRGERARGGTRERHPVEAVLLVLTSTALAVALLPSWSAAPLVFPLLGTTVWAGMRFTPGAVALHGSYVSALVVTATELGAGSFAQLDSGPARALFSQLFVGMVLAVGMLLALASTERRRLELTLRRSHDEAANQAALLATVIESMQEGVTVLDAHGRVQLLNSAAESLLHVTLATHDDAHAAPGLEVLDVQGRPLPAGSWPYARALRGEEVDQQELRLRFEGVPDRDVAVRARALPFATAEGVEQAVVVYHDITDERAHRVGLESFARVVAHDLKGPLAVVEGWSELLAGDAEEHELLRSADVATTVARIRGAAATMHQLIRDLLEQSVTREQSLQAVDVDLRSLCEQVAEQHREVTAGPRPVIQVLEVPPVHADEAQVRQLLHNLLGNAVKYVAPGEVPEVHVRGRRVGDRVEVVVADRGIGIATGAHDDVFAVFRRAPAAAAYEGQGIGLSVCQTIVTRHGGSIRARPRADGPGTEFVLTLPAVPVAVG